MFDFMNLDGLLAEREDLHMWSQTGLAYITLSVFGFWCAAIAKSKNYRIWFAFLCGMGFHVFAVIIYYCVKPGPSVEQVAAVIEVEQNIIQYKQNSRLL